MRYILYNCEYPVMLFETDDHYLCTQAESLDPERTPFSVRYQKGNALIRSMNTWIKNRTIPLSRPNMKPLYDRIGSDNIEHAFLAGLRSLSDGYWVYKILTPPPPSFDTMRYRGKRIWQEQNFWDNPFSYDIGNFLFGIHLSEPDMNTPDLTTSGRMPKTWRRQKAGTYLLKSGTDERMEGPYMETLVSLLMERMTGVMDIKVPFVRYHMEKIRGRAFCICENFVEKGMEFVPASELICTEERPDFLPRSMFLEERCRYFKIPGYKDFFDILRYLDFLTGNPDRHYGNFGFLYDVQKKQFIGPAPIFDNGSAFSFEGSWLPATTHGKETTDTTLEQYAHDHRVLEKRSITALLPRFHHPEKLQFTSGYHSSALEDNGQFQNNVSIVDQNMILNCRFLKDLGQERITQISKELRLREQLLQTHIQKLCRERTRTARAKPALLIDEH